MSAKVYTPETLEEALRLLWQGDALPVAGCTNYLVDRKKGKTGERDLVSLDRLEALREIHESADGLHIGSLAVFSQLERDPRVPVCLRQAAAQVGGPQIRNRGTIGGNIVSASPAADSVPALLALDARLCLVSEGGGRSVELRDFLRGPGNTDLRAQELLTEIVLPQKEGVSGFYKVGKRNALAISVVNMALYLDARDGKIVEIAAALGSVAPVALRALEAERFLTGKPLAQLSDKEVLGEAVRLLRGGICPISDLRASGEYRRMVAGTVFAKLLGELSEKAACPERNEEANER